MFVKKNNKKQGKYQIPLKLIFNFRLKKFKDDRKIGK